MPEFHTIRPYPRLNEPAARKDASGENFPVASRLLPRHLRPHVNAYYGFVRLADDIADDPDLDADVKLVYLDALERALVRGEGDAAYLAPALQLRASFTLNGLPDSYARHLLQAFRRDSRNERCRTWDDLMVYCRYSAVPVGRYLLALHGEGPHATAASDALCVALQVLNHLQDARDDWCDLGRLYIPLAWFDEAGISPERLIERESNVPIRAIFDRTLDRVDVLLGRAASLPGLIGHRGLRLEAAVIVSLAQTLARRLRRNDPLAHRVALSTPAKLGASARGLVHGLMVR